MQKKFLTPLFKYFIIYLFLPLIYAVLFSMIRSGYNTLSQKFPEIFTRYSQVLDIEEYLMHISRCKIFAVLISVFLTSFIAAIFENTRYEMIISKTDGFFKIPQELPSYLKETSMPDALAAICPPALFVFLSSVNYPEKIEKFVSRYLEMHLILLDAGNVATAFIIIAATAFAARIVSAPFALRRYRALWLTSFIDS